MPRSNPFLWPKPPAIWGYGLAVLSVAAALVISRLPAIHLQDAPVSLFLCAVLLSSWFSGIGPGLLATTLSALAFNYYFLPPIHSLGPKPDEIPRLVIFTVSALFVGSLSAAERSAIESFRRDRDDLKKTVQELQNTNEALQAESDERQRAEEALRRSEGYLAEAQRLTHTGSWAWRVAGRDALHLSEEWYRIYGFDPENGPPAFEQLLQRTHPEDRARLKGAIDRAIDRKSDYEVEFRIVLPDDTTKYIHTVGHPILNASGDLVQFVGSSTDITERKRAEQATCLLAAIVESSHDAIVSKTLNGVITSWNKGAERLFGYAAEEAVGQNITMIIPPERRDEERMIVEQLTRGDRVDHFETVRRRKDGSLIDVSLTISPMKDASGRVVGASKLARDITERKRAEEALRQAQTDLAHASRLTTMGELTASLAHEVKQPIAAAVTDANTCVRWITRDEPDLKEAREAAWRIVKDAERASEIINRVRLLFKKGTPQRELVDVNEVAREMIVLLGDEASRHSISVRTELAEDLPHVIGDRVQLQQVLMNLIVNAVDAMHDVDGQRELIIKSQPAENHELLLSVSDTGVGLPRHQADRIFNAFFTTKTHGTGMGLRISRSIIESHGGRLWAAGNSPRGARFCFTLPT